MRLGRDRGGKKYRIDRRARATRRLPQPDAAAEQGVLGRRGIGPDIRLGYAQRSSSSAAAMIARARG